MKTGYRNAVRVAAAAAALLFVWGCASTRITSDWKDESYREKPGKIVVVAALQDSTTQRLMEDELVKRLRKADVSAIQGYVALPEGEQKPSETSLPLGDLQFDALLRAQFIERKTVREYYPGPGYYPISQEDICAYASGFYNPYSYAPGFAPLNPAGMHPAYPSGYNPAYIDIEEYDIIETNLYLQETGQIVWSAISESRVGKNAEAEVSTYAKEIVNSLEKKKVIR